MDQINGSCSLDEFGELEVSAAEQGGPKALQPADGFEAFQALIDEGKRVEGLAARFGMSAEEAIRCPSMLMGCSRQRVAESGMHPPPAAAERPYFSPSCAWRSLATMRNE